MKFTLKIESEDQAMTDYPIEEMTQILSDIIKKLTSDYNGGTIHDTNGNKIGNWGISGV